MAISAGIFRQYDIRGIVDKDLTVEAARGVGRAYAAYLAEHGIKGAVAIGRDNRPSGAKLRDALAGGLRECGVDIVDIGTVPTPVLYWGLHHLNVVGGIQITGSHNPPEYNGFKMSVGKESLHGHDITHLYELISAGTFPKGSGASRKEAVIRSGVDIVDIGTVPTPVLYWGLHHLNVVGGIQITGSHNPPEYNGFKMSVGKESLHGHDITHLYELISAGTFPKGSGASRKEAVI